MDNNKFKDKKKMLTLPPIPEELAPHDDDEPDSRWNKGMGQRLRKKKFDCAIRDESMNWIECTMRSDGLNVTLNF
jgi:hypothetical protein